MSRKDTPGPAPGTVQSETVKMSVLSGKSYLTEFNCKEYLSLFHSACKDDSNTKGSIDFYRTHLYQFYAKFSSKWNNKTARLLEFGGGPVITSLISAAPYVDQITFAAYTESERKEIELWKQGKEGGHDWSSDFKYVLYVIENVARDDTQWHQREELVRNRISNIIACDIFCDNPLITEQEPFEIISTSLCLEAACTTFAEYKEGVKKLIRLLKPGGFLLMFIVERETFYMVGEKRWFCLYLTLEQVQEALAEAGTVVLVAERDPMPMDLIQNPVICDCKAVAFVVAQKVEF